jgi:acylphosphatase
MRNPQKANWMKGEEKSSTRTGRSQLHASVEGRVQGVGFRAFTQKIAVVHDLTGWVRNRWDGTVEILAEGEKSNLEEFLNKVHRGPFPGTTKKVNAFWDEATGKFSRFRIRETG